MRDRVARTAKRPDHVHPAAEAGQKRRQKHALHAVVTAPHHEDLGQGEIVPVSHEHVEHAKGRDGQDRAAGLGDGGTHRHKNTGADRSADAQGDDVPQAEVVVLFLFHKDHSRSRLSGGSEAIILTLL